MYNISCIAHFLTVCRNFCIDPTVLVIGEGSQGSNPHICSVHPTVRDRDIHSCRGCQVIIHFCPYPTLHTFLDPTLHTFLDPTLHTFLDSTLHTFLDPTLHTFLDPTLHTFIDPTLHIFLDPTLHTFLDPTHTFLVAIESC